jgi:hypothetical protein
MSPLTARYLVLQQTGYHCWSLFVQLLLSNCLCVSGFQIPDNVSALQKRNEPGKIRPARHGHRMFLSFIGGKAPGSYTSTYKLSIHGPSLPQTGEKRPRMETTTAAWPSTPSLPRDSPNEPRAPNSTFDDAFLDHPCCIHVMPFHDQTEALHLLVSLSCRVYKDPASW